VFLEIAASKHHAHDVYNATELAVLYE